jgi:hypothetical protein
MALSPGTRLGHYDVTSLQMEGEPGFGRRRPVGKTLAGTLVTPGALSPGAADTLTSALTVTLFVTVRTENLVNLAYVEKAKERKFPSNFAKLLIYKEW